MAACNPDILQDENFWEDENSDTEIDYEEFSTNFEFFNSSTCWVCNGYYGASFGEPLCGTCHSFIFPSCDELPVTQLSDDEDSGNDEPPYNVQDKERQEREEVRQGRQRQSPEEEEFMYEVLPNPTEPRDLNQYFDLLSQPWEENNSQQITCLPVEVLLSIFSYLDDISLCNVSEVCKHWRKILDLNTSQQMWKKYIKERWPLFQPIVFIPNFLDMYTSLMSSCFCRTCLLKMAVKTPHRGRVNVLRINRLRNDIRSLDDVATEGYTMIDAVPLDYQLSYWQASILGPPNSPYEGGKFFLSIVIPYSYPMLPPTVRFLTKIVHPNVSRHGDVGIDIIQHNWSLILTISKLLLSVQSLLTDPFTEICMEPELGRMYDHDRLRFEALARRWTWKYAMHEFLPI